MDGIIFFMFSLFFSSAIVLTYICAVLRCGINQQEGIWSIQRSTSTSGAIEPSHPGDATSHPEAVVSPMIDALIVSSIPPLPQRLLRLLLLLPILRLRMAMVPLIGS